MDANNLQKGSFRFIFISFFLNFQAELKACRQTLKSEYDNSSSKGKQHKFIHVINFSLPIV